MTKPDAEMGDLARTLHQLIVRSVPGVTYLSRYGGVLYTTRPREKQGHFCGVYILEDHVRLEFSNGAKLKDRTKMLLGRERARRHVLFYSHDDLPADEVVRLFKQAGQVALVDDGEAGKKSSRPGRGKKR